MNYYDLIQKRKSTRAFKEKSISAEQIEEIRAYFPVCQRLVPEINVEFYTFYDKASEDLNGVAGYGGVMISAPYYLVLLSETSDHYLENAGYICEDLILKLTDMGLDNCWISFADGDAVKHALHITNDKQPVAIIACGYGIPEKDSTRLDIKSPSDVHVTKRKGHIAPKITIEDMVYYQQWGKPIEDYENLVDPVLDKAFFAASLSPTFLNRQPYRFILDSGMVVLVEREDELTNDMNARLNTGIIMLNFGSVLSSGWYSSKWVIGQPDRSYDLPEGHTIIGYCPL